MAVVEGGATLAQRFFFKRGVCAVRQRGGIGGSLLSAQVSHLLNGSRRRQEFRVVNVHTPAPRHRRAASAAHLPPGPLANDSGRWPFILRVRVIIAARQPSFAKQHFRRSVHSGRSRVTQGLFSIGLSTRRYWRSSPRLR